MSWRVVVISSTSKLDYKMDYLVVRNADSTKRIHLSEISVLLIESTAVSLTAYLLCELSKRKIDVIFCDEKRLPYGMMSLLYGSHDTSLKYRNQVNWDYDIKGIIWAEIVRAKINGQIQVLKYFGHDEYILLEKYLTEIVPNDETNREGHAAKVYFNALFGMEFSRSQENVINASLNYGYGILLSVFSREIVSCGYATQFGIFHDNMFNRLNLACDFMEPYRPLIDFFTIKWNNKIFEHEQKLQIVDILNKNISIDGYNQLVLNSIKVSTKSFFNALEEKDISLMKFPNYELQIYENDDII